MRTELLTAGVGVCIGASAVYLFRKVSKEPRSGQSDQSSRQPAHAPSSQSITPSSPAQASIINASQVILATLKRHDPVRVEGMDPKVRSAPACVASRRRRPVCPCICTVLSVASINEPL